MASDTNRPGASHLVYHFTCAAHGFPGISQSGIVIPNWHPRLSSSLAWFTSEAHPDREASGLGMHITKCDRMAYRFTASRASVTPWLDCWERKTARSWTINDLERYGDPEHWFVSRVPVPALIDLSYAPSRGGVTDGTE